MSESHKQVLLRHCDENKIIVLNVPDPYGRPIEVYEECAKQLESQFTEILERIQNSLSIREMAESDIGKLQNWKKNAFQNLGVKHL